MARKRKNKSKIYFGTPAQDAIVEYNNCDDPVERDKIYKERIKYPFEKLVENVINTYKFQYFDESKEDVQREVVSTLVEKMHMYEEGKGRAFSYFSVIAKNHLIHKNNGNYKRWKSEPLISEMPEHWNPEDEYEKERKTKEYKEFKQIMLDYWENKLTDVFDKKRDLQIADSILELLRRSESIEKFEKKYLYILIREMTGCKTHYITKVVNEMRKHHNRILDEYLEYGDITDKELPFWESDTEE